MELRCKRIDDHEITRGNLQLLKEGKAITKGELRRALDFELTGEEWEDDIAGDPSPAEKEQQQQGQQGGMPEMPGMEGEGQPSEEELGEEGGSSDLEQVLDFKPDELRSEDKETAASKPNPGTLGLDSLGPRGKPNQPPVKHLNGRLKALVGVVNGNGHAKTLRPKTKSLYQQVRERLQNGC